ncbi:unnamed protein product [Soboliphyme baturini]|uniref:Uncharacterized protein n=1 Tax=Soboliphyme baturini TaxID=241478 RepID=A0A183JB95_9BILA|nr:unnamed protein product [Soboliphyme baturini]
MTKSCPYMMSATYLKLTTRARRDIQFNRQILVSAPPEVSGNRPI